MDFEPHPSLSAFFHEAVRSAIKNQGVDTSEMTEFYLVQLLSDYASTPVDDAPLAVQMAEAQMASPEERAQKLRGLGDRSLYVSGFFSESLQRRLVDVDYYMRMGGTAYRQLARMPMRSAHQAEVFLELSGKFPRFVDVLAEVSELSSLSSDAGVLSLYEKWLRTGSAWIGRRLRAAGMLPGSGEVQ